MTCMYLFEANYNFTVAGFLFDVNLDFFIYFFTVHYIA